ncbi:hypothetical protein T10_7219, partial [Trichinella papuae]
LHGVRCDLCDYVGVSKRAVGMHRRRHANENIMQITGTAAQIEALSKQVGDIRVAGDYSQFKFGKRVRQYVAPTQRQRMEEDLTEEEEVPAEPRTILGEPSTATTIVDEEISAKIPSRADPTAPQMICRIGQWCVWPQDYHSIPAPQCWTDTLMDLMIEQIVLQQYSEHDAVGVMSLAAILKNGLCFPWGKYSEDYERQKKFEAVKKRFKVSRVAAAMRNKKTPDYKQRSRPVNEVTLAAPVIPSSSKLLEKSGRRGSRSPTKVTDYHSIPAPPCWTDTLMDLMIEQIVLRQYPDYGAVGMMSSAARHGLSILPEKVRVPVLETCSSECRNIRDQRGLNILLSYMGTVTAMLEWPLGWNLREAELIFRWKLAPWQKMDAYRTYVLPRLTFQLTIAKFHNIKESAGVHDRAILRLVKRCFQLPVETSTDFVTRALKMLWSPCQVVSTLATRQLRTVASAYFAKRSKEVEAADLSTFMNAARSTPLDQSGYPTCLWMDARKQMAYLTKVAGVDSYFLVGETGTSFIIRNGLGQTVSVLSPLRKNKVMSVLGGAIQTRHLDAWLQCKRQGKTASCVVLDRSSSRFITTGRYTSFAALRFALPARLDLLPCRARSSKRSYQNCRRCGYDRETLPHILQHCRQFSAPAYQARHDAVQGRLETVMRRRFPNLRVNRALPEIGSNKRPDLVVVDEDARSVILLDVAIVFENTAAAFVDARIRKWAHYEKEILAYRLQGYSVTYDAIVVGSLGTWDPKNDAILKRIGVVSERYLRLMKVLVVSEMLEHSSRIYRRHLGLRDLLPKTDTNRRPVGTTETDPPGGDLRQKKRNSICAKLSRVICLEGRNTSPVGMPLQRGELQCQPSIGPLRPALAGTVPVPPRVQPAPTRLNQ